MPSVQDIDWDQVTLEQGMTPERVIAAYESAVKDLVHLNKEFNRFFSGKKKKATYKIMTYSIFDAVQLYVFYNPNDEIDVSGLVRFISSDDRGLFSDVVKFVYQFFHEKGKTMLLLNRFKGLLVYYLCKVGF